MDNLDDAISADREAALSLPKGPHRATALNVLCRRLHSRYRRSLNIADLNEAIRSAEDAAAMCDANEAELPRVMANLCEFHHSMYEKSGNLRDLDESIRCGQEAARQVKPTSHDMAVIAHMLSRKLQTRFEKCARRIDLDEALRLSQVAVRETSLDDTNFGPMINTLCELNALTGSLENVVENIKLIQDLLSDLPSKHANRGPLLHALDGLMDSRYGKTRDPKDLDLAIQYASEAVRATPNDHFNRAPYLFALSLRYRKLYEKTKEIADMDHAILYGQEAVEATAHASPHLATRLFHLAKGFKLRYEASDDPTDIESAIRIARSAIEARPKDMPGLSTYWAELGGYIELKYQKSSSIEDADDSIRAYQNAFLVAPKATVHWLLMYLKTNILSTSVHDKTGKSEYLEISIRMGYSALGDVPNNWQHTAVILDVLSGKLGKRYFLYRAKEDLEEERRLLQKCLEMTSSDSPYRAQRLEAFASVLITKFQGPDHPHQLQNAMEYITKALDIPTASTEVRIECLRARARCLRIMFEHGAKPNDIEEAINSANEAVKLAEPESTKLPYCLFTLVECMSARSDHTKLRDDIDKVVDTAEMALTKISNSYVCQAEITNHLSDALMKRSDIEEDFGDRRRALALCSSIAEMENVPAWLRITCARKACITAAHLQDWPKAVSALQKSSELYPLLHLRSLLSKDQERFVSHMAMMNSYTGTAYLNAGLDASAALLQMESNRGVMASLLIDSRPDLTDLASQAPELQKRYVETTKALSSLTALPTTDDDDDDAATEFNKFSRRREILREAESIKNEIQKLPQYRDFQTLATAEDLKDLAKRGPLVSFCVTRYRADAFLVTDSDIRTVPLTKLKWQDLDANLLLMTGDEKITEGQIDTVVQRNIKMRKLLKWTWNVIVHPVLQDLGFLKHDQCATLPRIWWVTSGPIGLLPLHAAGYDWGFSDTNTSSHVVSSYTTNLKALKYAREQIRKQSGVIAPRVFVAKMADTPGWQSLSVADEAAAVGKAFEGCAVSIKDSPSKEEVVQELGKSSIVHFACHGEDNPADPSSGGMLFFGKSSKELEKLKISDLTSLSQNEAIMAYLSACSTAENSSHILLDECIHLSSAFQLAGFPHVIGTLWTADDEAARDVAIEFYNQCAERIKATSVAEAMKDPDVFARLLHSVMEKVRVRGASTVSKMRIFGNDVLAWAPFIHVGC